MQSSKCKVQNYGSFLKKTFHFLPVLLTFYFLLLTFSNPVYAADPHPCTLLPADLKRIDHEEEFGPCPGGLQEIENMVGNFLSVVVGLGFIAMLVLLIFAGIKYLTSGGEPKAVQSAHYMLTWALLGIFFMAVAWLILQLVAGFTEVNVTVFDIKKLCGGTSLPFCQP